MKYTHKKTIESPGFTIRVFSPVISAEEHAKRMNGIRKAAENLLKKVPKR